MEIFPCPQSLLFPPAAASRLDPDTAPGDSSESYSLLQAGCQDPMVAWLITSGSTSHEFRTGFQGEIMGDSLVAIVKQWIVDWDRFI